MEYKKKLVYLSNHWYNDGLNKANIRDLSGAVSSLKKSLQYNRYNISSRNLLGLVYYGRGEVAEALVEWIISKNMKSHRNIADYYIKKVQQSTSELDAIDQAVKRYNQCLGYCQQNGEDLAAIQLKKVIAAHPTFLKAYQLLALLCMQTEQYAKARQYIRKAHRLDTTNEITLRYMYELKRLHQEKAVQLKTTKESTRTYKVGNDTIIQPISTTLKDNATILTILNIVLGLVIGMMIVWFLAVPTIKRNMSDKTNKEIIVYSEQIAELESEVELLKKEVNGYKENNDETEAEKVKAQGTQAGYEALVTVVSHYYKPNYKRSKLVDELLLINTASLGEVGLSTYNSIAQEVFPAECKEIYPSAMESYKVLNYTRATELLERVVQMDAKYEKGEALFTLLDIYVKKNNVEKATEKYNRIIELFADTDLANRAKELMKSVEQPKTE